MQGRSVCCKVSCLWRVKRWQRSIFVLLVNADDGVLADIKTSPSVNSLYRAPNGVDHANRTLIQDTVVTWKSYCHSALGFVTVNCHFSCVLPRVFGINLDRSRLANGQHIFSTVVKQLSVRFECKKLVARSIDNSITGILEWRTVDRSIGLSILTGNKPISRDFSVLYQYSCRFKDREKNILADLKIFVRKGAFLDLILCDSHCISNG